MTSTVTGPYTGFVYTAKWHDWLDGFWSYTWTDDAGRSWGPSVSYTDQQHPTREMALADAVERDIVSAAQADYSPLDAETYARECVRLGLEHFDDVDTYGIRYGQPSVSEVGARRVAALALARRRLKAFDREREEAARVATEEVIERRVAALTTPDGAGEIVEGFLPSVVTVGHVILLRKYPHRVVASRRFTIDEDAPSLYGEAFLGQEGEAGSRIEAVALPIDEARAWLRDALRAKINARYP